MRDASKAMWADRDLRWMLLSCVFATVGTLCAIGVLLHALLPVAQQIDEHGLKPIVERIWEGKP